MSIYHYTSDSPISEVSIRREEDHQPSALLSAGKNLTAAQAMAMRDALAKNGWLCVPTHNGQVSQLQISGFPDEPQLMQVLETHGFVRGAPTLDQAKTEVKEQGPMRRFFQRFSLFLSGVLNLFGDISLLWNGLEKKNKYDIAAGAFYTLGGLNLTLFGAGDPNTSVRDVSEQTAQFIANEVGLAPDTGLAAVHANRTTGFFTDVKRFLQRNPAQVTLVPYIVGAVAMMWSGINRFRADHSEWRWMAAGISSVFFKAASLLIPELKSSDENEKPKGLIGWIREKPLRLFGYGSFVTDSLMIYAAVQDDKQKGKPWAKGVAAGSLYLASDSMMAISHKDRGSKLTADEQSRVESLAAEAIACAPEPRRGELTGKVARFLERKLPGRSAEKLQAELQVRVAQLEQNPWSQRVQQPPVAETASQPTL